MLLRNTISYQSLQYYDLSVPIFCDVPWAWDFSVFYKCILWDWAPKSAFWLVVVFWSALCLLQRKLSLMRTEYYTHLWVWGQMFIDCSQRLYWCNKSLVVEFPSITMLSLALSSYLCFQDQTWYLSCWVGLTSI